MGRVVIVLFLILCSMSAFAQSSGFVGGTTISYTGSGSGVAFHYADGVSGNPDVGLESCNTGSGGFAAGFYALNTGSFIGVPVTYQSAVNSLSPVTVDTGSSCLQTSNNGLMFVSPSTFPGGGSPATKIAAFPGQLWIGEASSANPGSVSTFDFAGSNAVLAGSYTVQRSYSQGLNTITAQAPTIRFSLTAGGTLDRSATDATFGVSTDKNLVMGVCDDANGANCDDGSIIDDSGDFPAVYTPSFSGAVNDQNIYTKYVVINGLGYDMCIGANLQASVPSVSPDPVYYSQNLSFTTRASNVLDSGTEQDGGNVAVTSSFVVNVSIYPQGSPGSPVYTNDYTVSSGVPVSASVDEAQVWPAFALSGIYTIAVEADGGSAIVECDENDNTASTTFELKPITLPEIFIDGTETTEFPAPNAPYNLTMFFKNSDNVTLSNATVVMTETNGLNMFTPTQFYNHTIDGSNTSQRTGLVTQTVTTFNTDFFGNTSFTIIPTYNRLYDAAYNYTDIEDHIGGYNITLSGTQSDGEQFIFIRGGQVFSFEEFTIANTSYTGPWDSKTIPQNTLVSQVMDFVYQGFSAFLDSVVS